MGQCECEWPPLLAVWGGSHTKHRDETAMCPQRLVACHTARGVGPQTVWPPVTGGSTALTAARVETAVCITNPSSFVNTSLHHILEHTQRPVVLSIILLPSSTHTCAHDALATCLYDAFHIPLT